MVALQDEFADGKQAQEDKNGVECGAEESADHVQFSLLLVPFVASTTSEAGLTVTSNQRVPGNRRVNEHTGSSSV